MGYKIMEKQICESSRILAIIPARGGSRGVPRKKIRPLAGKPLIAYTIEVAKQSKYLNRIIVSDEQSLYQVDSSSGIEVTLADGSDNIMAHFFAGKSGSYHSSGYVCQADSDNVYLVDSNLQSIFGKESKEYCVVAIIPARGGSKGVPRKNIKLLAGKPLIAYTIETALDSKLLDRIIVSTDDSEIAEIARSYGAEVPFIRPKELAEDDVPDLPVFQHALRYLEKNENWQTEIVVNLRPTAPFRTSGHIDDAIRKLIETDADSVRTVCEVEHHPYWMKTLEGDKAIPLIPGKTEDIFYQRQLLPPVYRLNGVVDVMRRKFIMEENMLFGPDTRVLIIDKIKSFDINTPFDFLVAELIIREGMLNE